MNADLAARIQMMSIQIVPFFVAIVFHELGHGLMARHWGDTTAEREGRLTLNPVAHIHPIGTVLIPIVNMITGIPLLFGWAKPVPINPNRFRKYRPGLFWVSLAGPAANVFLAFASALLFHALSLAIPEDFYLYDPITKMCMVGVQINYSLALFNLLPIPPLDGGRIIESMVGFQGTQRLRVLEGYSFWILLGLLWTGALSILGGPIMTLSYKTLVLAGQLFPTG